MVEIFSLFSAQGDLLVVSEMIFLRFFVENKLNYELLLYIIEIK